MSRISRIVLLSMTVVFILCTGAFASITGCTVTSHTKVSDPNNTEYLTMMNTCSEITLEDVLEIDFAGGMVPLSNKTFTFTNTSGKHGQIKANGFSPLGEITVKLAPMENAALTGAWASKESLGSSPYELITITNTSGYMDPAVMDLIKEYKGDSSWTAFWKAGYWISNKTDPDNGKLKAVTLTWSKPTPEPTSGDISADVVIDDGGGGCNIGLFGLLGVLGIGFVVRKAGLGKDDIGSKK